MHLIYHIPYLNQTHQLPRSRRGFDAAATNAFQAQSPSVNPYSHRAQFLGPARAPSLPFCRAAAFWTAHLTGPSLRWREKKKKENYTGIIPWKFHRETATQLHTSTSAARAFGWRARWRFSCRSRKATRPRVARSPHRKTFMQTSAG